MEDEANRFVAEDVDEVPEDRCEREFLSVRSGDFRMEDGRAFSHVNIRCDGAQECTKNEKDSTKDSCRSGKGWNSRCENEESCCQRENDVGYSFHDDM